MSEATRPYNEIDDYMAAFSDEERQEYAAAEAALDLASLLYRTQQEQGLTQHHAAERSDLQQQAMSRLEKAASTMQLGMLQRYLRTPGYRLEISIIDNRTGKRAGNMSRSESCVGAVALPVCEGRCTPFDR